MSDSEFDYIRALVYERSRIRLDPGRRVLVAARLAKRLRANRLGSVTEYCRILRSPRHEEERALLIDAIATNHTFFFRESAHFDLVRDRLIPDLAARASRECWPRLYAWSAACSSGEEAYSLAITLADRLGDSSWPWHVEATDISRRMLDLARAAVYPADSVRSHIPAWARAFFQRGTGPQEGRSRVKASVRSNVTFRHLNLLGGPPPFTEAMHLIFCRNVMIYFDRPTQEELVRVLVSRLVPGGYLFVGHSESLAGIAHGLEAVQPSVYRRPAAP